MEIPDLLDSMPHSCGDCEYYNGKPPYKMTGNCEFRAEGLMQDTHLDGMPRPMRIDVVMRSSTDATRCPHFEWSEEARRETESAIHDGYLEPVLGGRMHP